jgi:hypothetical protein
MINDMQSRQERLRTTRCFGLHLIFLAARSGTDGLILTNKCLQSFFELRRIYRKRVEQLAGDLSHLFPYQEIWLDSRRARTLTLGFVQGTPPESALKVQTLPTFSDICAQVGIDVLISLPPET